MPQKQITGEGRATDRDGWTVEDPSYFQFVVGLDAPRPGSVFRMLKTDAGSWQVLLYWATGFGLFAVGVVAVWVGVGSVAGIADQRSAEAGDRR
jgi:hypothetical protein